MGSIIGLSRTFWFSGVVELTHLNLAALILISGTDLHLVLQLHVS